MNEKEIFDKYIKVNDYIAIFSANNESIEGYVNDIDDYFLHMQIGEQCRLFRLSHIFSFVILKRYDPSEGDLDRSTIHMGRIISYKPKTLMGTISDETDGGQPRFFHLNQVDPSELNLRNILMVDGWSGTKVKFRLGLNKKGVCAQDIRMDSPSSLKYIEGEQTAIIDYYSNSGKRGYLQIEGLHETVPFHLGQVQSEELANALLRGRWRGIKVHFYFGYKSFLLCASEVREVEALSHFDEQDYLSGSIVECSPISKNTVITIRDQNGNEYKTDQRKLADLVLFDLIRERWNFADTDCQVKFRTYSYDGKVNVEDVFISDTTDEVILSKIDKVLNQWSFTALPHKPTPLEELPENMISSEIFRRVREMNENGDEDAAFQLLEEYEKYLDPEKKKNWELLLAAHSKRHDGKLLSLLNEEDEQTAEDDAALPDDKKSNRATRLEMLRAAYNRIGEVERVQELSDRVELLRFREDTGITRKCIVEVTKVGENLKRILCSVMPEIWNVMYPDGKGNKKITDWEYGYLYTPPADYRNIYENREKHKNFMRTHKKKYNTEATLQAVLSLRDTESLINHYFSSDWYEKWYRCENKVAPPETPLLLSCPCFYNKLGEKWNENIREKLKIVITERDRLSHPDVHQDPGESLEIYKEVLSAAKEINRLLYESYAE